LNEALRCIQELRIEKESLESQRIVLENENNDQCTEFNGKIYELNTEIKDKKRLIELLSGEKEVLLSDLKNITKDRDKIQRESSIALKEITELAVSETFPGCSSKDLSSLECSVAWIKGKCLDLNNFKISSDLEILNLKQAVQELEKVLKIKTEELKGKTCEIEIVKIELDELKVVMDNPKKDVECLNDFKVKIKGLGFQDDLNLFDNIYEKLKTLSDQKSETELEVKLLKKLS
jgi:cAMP phosphodiesterase